MIDTTTARLVERNMTRHRIHARPAPPPAPAPAADLAPGPGQWDCARCGGAWHGTPPEDRTCPGGCTTAA